MSVNEAIERLEGKTVYPGELAVILREAKEIIEHVAIAKVERTTILERAERWLKE